VRALGQPLTAAWPPAAPLLPLSGALELGGAGLAVGLLGATAVRGVPPAQRPGYTHVLPWLVLVFASFLVGLALNLAGLVAAAASPLALVPAPWQPLVLLLGLYGFLVGICVAMSARTFPLYLRVRVAPTATVNGLLGVFLLGLLARAAAILGGPPALEPLGQVVLGVALVGAALLVDAPFLLSRRAVLAEAAHRAASYGQASRLAAPRESEYIAADWLLRSAYSWLLVAAALLLVGGLLGLVGGTPPPPDAERHALGAGFVTLLIFGMGVHLLPGFLSRRIASARLVWATLWLGGLAALLRVVPPLAAWLLALLGDAALPTALSASLQGTAGLLDLGAVICFGVNLWRTWR
jgi:uncharacterized protein involved in response to NO